MPRGKSLYRRSLPTQAGKLPCGRKVLFCFSRWAAFAVLLASLSSAILGRRARALFPPPNERVRLPKAMLRTACVHPPLAGSKPEVLLFRSQASVLKPDLLRPL